MNFAALQNNGDNTQTTIEYEVDILLDGYVGAIIPVKGAGDPVKIQLPDFDDLLLALDQW